MRTRSIVVAAVAAAVLAIGGGTALALGAGADQPGTPVPVSGSAPADPTTPAAPAEQLRPAGPVVDRADAERNALRAAGGGVITSVELDDRDDDGDDRAWEIEIRNGDVEHEIDIDRSTGAVLDHDIDRDDNRDDNDDD